MACLARGTPKPALPLHACAPSLPAGLAVGWIQTCQGRGGARSPAPSHFVLGLSDYLRAFDVPPEAFNCVCNFSKAKCTFFPARPAFKGIASPRAPAQPPRMLSASPVCLVYGRRFPGSGVPPVFTVSGPPRSLPSAGPRHLPSRADGALSAASWTFTLRVPFWGTRGPQRKPH